MSAKKISDALQGVPLPGEGEPPWRLVMTEQAFSLDDAYELAIRSLAAGMMTVLDEAEEIPSSGFSQWLRDQVAARYAEALAEDSETGYAWFAPTGFQWAAAQNAVAALRGTPPQPIAMPGETHPAVLLLLAGEYDETAVEKPKRKRKAPAKRRAPAKKRTAK